MDDIVGFLVWFIWRNCESDCISSWSLLTFSKYHCRDDVRLMLTVVDEAFLMREMCKLYNIFMTNFIWLNVITILEENTFGHNK